MTLSHEISEEAFQAFMTGKTILGDDFSIEEIENWYKDEEHASFDIYNNVDTTQYDAFNFEHGFSKIAGRTFRKCVALGTADGKDVEPLARQVDEFVAIEPEEKWWRTEIGGRKTSYLKPSIAGVIPLPDGSADLGVALGVLHHIPNVSFVISEIHRVLAPGGIFIVREPVVSMGDWRKPRRGMSARERGIPPKALLDSVRKAGFEVMSSVACDHPLIPKIASLLGISTPYNKKLLVWLDRILSRMTAWNMHYYPLNGFQKVAPASLFLVCRKG